MNEWISFAVAWLPFVLLIAVWFWFARRNGMQARGSSGSTMIELTNSRSRRPGG